MRVLDLFSGIGGFSLGLERAGMETVAFCEVDPFCRKVLAKHWPNKRIHEDVRQLDGREYRGTIDVVCGGFPCQPFSLAGKRAGKDDDRHLWPEMHRIISEVQPSYVIGENVAGFVNMELDACLSDLEAIGYSCGAFIVPACAVDAQHRRDRVWILGTNVGNASGQQWGSNQPREGGRWLGVDRPVLEEARWEKASDQLSGSGQDDANSNRSLEQGDGSSFGEEAEQPNFGIGVRWAPEPGVGRVAHGIPNGMDRLKSLGNAVVPQVVEQIGRVIMEDAWARSKELNMTRSSPTSSVSE